MARYPRTVQQLTSYGRLLISVALVL